eukprot:TRINITY_DN37052_c0_g1_i1.p1 TRINITY_DN37052_c0_g1~~TRINITY_DN37052_c0_g1_i1.p1  ORF type:complete len:192 (+),score=25.03 TRINITY_DN37052_c0_g1_i1:115-690(+)
MVFDFDGHKPVPLPNVQALTASASKFQSQPRSSRSTSTLDGSCKRAGGEPSVVAGFRSSEGMLAGMGLMNSKSHAASPIWSGGSNFGRTISDLPRFEQGGTKKAIGMSKPVGLGSFGGDDMSSRGSSASGRSRSCSNLSLGRGEVSSPMHEETYKRELFHGKSTWFPYSPKRVSIDGSPSSPTFHQGPICR